MKSSKPNKHRDSEAHPPIGVIFDMDGVLVDSSDAHLQSWKLLAEQLGAELDEAPFRKTLGRQNRDIIPLLFGEHSADAIRRLADRKEQLYRDLVRHDPPIIDGAVELIQSLHQYGAALAVGSSGPRANIDLILQSMGVADLIRVIVSGDDVTNGKPDPEVFLLVIRRLNIPPGRCVVIEDAPAGIEAARRAAARTVALTTYNPASAFPKADLVIHDLRQCSPQHFASLLARD